MDNWNNRYAEMLENISISSGKRIEDFSFQGLTAFYNSVEGQMSSEDQIRRLRQTLDLSFLSILHKLNAKQQFIISIGDNEFDITGDNNFVMTWESWLDKLYIFLLIRTPDATEKLCSIPEEAINFTSQFEISFIRMMKGLFDPKANISQLFFTALEDSDPDLQTKDKVDITLDIMFPQIMLIKAILQGNNNEFNSELNRALEFHELYWKKRPGSNHGVVSLPLLALCALAIDNKGFDITEKSEVIPEWLYNKQF